MVSCYKLWFSIRTPANPSQLLCGQVITGLLRLMGLVTAGKAPPRWLYTGLFSLCSSYLFSLSYLLLHELEYVCDPNNVVLWWLQVTGPVALQEIRPSILRVALFLFHPFLWLLVCTVIACYGCLYLLMSQVCVRFQPTSVIQRVSMVTFS